MEHSNHITEYMKFHEKITLQRRLKLIVLEDFLVLGEELLLGYAAS
jgi:hypothetical protein